ncbi:TPA: phosphorylcholine transferase LicD, partial [Streptococcus suis]
RRVSDEEYKKILMKSLIEVDRICTENDINYALCYGTLLGAVRHEGFIPWDDDIDIIMPREDYDKLAHLINSQDDLPINFIRIEEQQDTCFPFGKICAKQTFIEESNLHPIVNYGAYIDVFPMNRLPLKTSKFSLMKWNIFLRLASYSKLKKVRHSKNIIITFFRYVEFYFSKLFGTKFLVNYINDNEKRIDNLTKKNDTAFCYGLLWDKVRFSSDIFMNQQKVKFEGHLFNGTSNPDYVLRQSFGEYWNLPPIEERVPHHHIVCYVES